MRQLLTVVTLFIGLSLSFVTVAEKYKEGKHYVVIPGEEKVTGELKEYFSLFCPSCRAMERVLSSVKQDLPSGMAFKRVHVDFLASPETLVQRMVTQALFYAKSVGEEEDFVRFMFDRIHRFKKRPTTRLEMKDALMAYGLTQEKAESILVDENLKIKQQASTVEQEKMYGLGVLRGVPSFRVNGKYMLNVSELDRKDPVKDLKKLIHYLNTK